MAAVKSPSHWCALCLCLMTSLVQCQMPSASDAQPPGGVKSNSVPDPITGFVEAVKTRPVDLIILMERSAVVGRNQFYNRARKLVSHVLRYYVKMGQSNVRLVLATFAKDITVHIHGLRDSITKCQIWDQYWDDVVLIDTDSVWNIVHVKRAYERAKAIFKQYGGKNRTNYIWLLTSGIYRMDSSIYDPVPIADSLRNMSVTIVATKVGGREGYKENIMKIVTSPRHHGGDVKDWIDKINKDVEEIRDAPDVMLSNESTQCYCEQTFGFTICGGCQGKPCASGATCSSDCICTKNPPSLCPERDSRVVCEFDRGKTGRYCDVNITECVRGTCANNGMCHEPNHSGDPYTCTCTHPYYGSLCEGRYPTPSPTPDDDGSNETAPRVSITSSVGLAVGGALGGLILIIILVAGICIWRKKRRPDTGGAETSANQNRPQTIPTITSLNLSDIFRHQRGMPTPSDASWGSYVDMQDLPPPVPTTLPPPTVRYLTSKPRRSLRRLLQYTSEYLHPSTHQEEVGTTVSVINVGHQGAAADGAHCKENGDYENVGSKDMLGWEKYVMNLVTEGGLRNFAIIKSDRDAYITTCEIWLLPTADELSHIYNIMMSHHSGYYINVKSPRYKVTKNNGKMLEAWLEGRTPDILCIGRSKQYLVLGVETDRAKTGNCYQKVRWVREYLSRQGY